MESRYPNFWVFGRCERQDYVEIYSPICRTGGTRAGLEGNDFYKLLIQKNHVEHFKSGKKTNMNITQF